MATYKTTTAFAEIVKLKKPVRIIQGGKGSSKTISILQHFILLAISKRKDLILSIVGESMPNLKSGALRDFDKILKSWGLYDKFKINKSSNTYTYVTDILDEQGNKIGVNENIIEFFSVDGEHSRLGSRRTHLYINEADAIKFNTYIELYSRTAVFTVMDYNPRRKFWAHAHLIGQDEVDFLILNFSHNEYIPKNELASIMWFKKKAEEGIEFFKNKWRVLGLGLLGIPEGVVFENWKKAEKIPEAATYLGAGIDWGFTNDPTTIVKLYKYDGKIYLLQYLYQKGLLNSQIAARIKQDKELMSGLIIADSAEPKSIAEIKAYGIKITACKKGAGSILDGIGIMQEFEFVLVGEELEEEFTNYCYKTNKAGENLGIPVDDYNHLIDPTRYFVVDRLAASAKTSRSLKIM